MCIRDSGRVDVEVLRHATRHATDHLVPARAVQPPGGIIADPRRDRTLSLWMLPLVLDGFLLAGCSAGLRWCTGAAHDLAIHHHYFLTGQRLPALCADADCFFIWSVKTLHFLVPPLILSLIHI